MNKFIFYSFILLLLLSSSLNLIDKCFSYKIEDVSATDHVTKSYSASSLRCTFGCLILCVETNPGDNCSSLEISGSNSTITNTTHSILSNETSSLSTLFIMTNFGNYSVTINSIHTINVECYQLDLNKVELQMQTDDYFYMFDGYSMGLKPRALLKMVGDVDPSISLHTINAYNSAYGAGIQNILFSTNYLFEYSTTLNTNMNLSNIIFTFYNGISKDFKLEPIGKDVFDNIYNIKTYPDEEYLSNLELFGYGETAMVQFTSNNTAFSNSYTMNINGSSTPTQITPIYGDENSTTYVYLLKSYQSPSTLYELYYVNDAEFIKSNLSLQANITQYKMESYPVGTGSNHVYQNDNIPMVIFGLNDNKTMKEFHPMIVSSYGYMYTKFPFGYSFVSPLDGYNINISLPIKETTSSSQYIQLLSQIDSSGYSFYYQYKYVELNNTGPIVYNYELIRVVEDLYLFRIHVKSYYGLKRINIAQSMAQHYGKEILVSGDLYDGIYEFVSITCSDVIIEIQDNFYNSYSLASPTYVSLNPLKIFISPAYKKNVNLLSMYDVSFLYNDIDVTNRRHYNVMYFSLPDSFPKDYQVGMLSVHSILSSPVVLTNPIDPENLFFNSWNSTIQKHQIEFYVDPNSAIGIYSFWFIFNLKPLNSEFLDSQLRIKKSNMDFLGPKFKQIKKIIPSSSVDSNNKFGIIGWSLEIEDPVNGFNKGYIIISGEMDKSIYNISINANDVKPGGDLYLGEYDIKLNISYPCISQNYIITEVVLYDRVLRASTFYTLSTTSSYGAVTNPFIYHLNDTSINKVPLTCAVDPIASSDTTPPVLSSFSLSKQVIDVSATNRQISFTFTATDLESGIKNHQYPSVYINDINNVLLECKSSIVSISRTSATYSCTIQLPISYGYPGIIILSVYNFVNNNGYSSGYSSAQLLDLGLPYYLNTTFDTNEPSITGHYKYRDIGGDLFLYGRALDGTTKVNIIFNDGTTSLIDPIIISSTVIKVQNVKATDKPFKVYIKTSTFTSNTITVTPIIYDYYLLPPTPTFPPTITPVPTNSPQSCPGTPVCGGPSNGKCIQNQGCVCYSPWLGLDCLSQIIVVNPPIINTGNNNSNSGSSGSDDSSTGSPSIEIIVPGTINNNTNNNGNNNTTPITYSSLISIIALREIDINGGVVKTHTFKENWLSKQIDTLTYTFYTSIENEDSSPTNVTAILKWFTNKTIISFANEELTMNPSSMKYTIEIGNYPFSSALNQLQLVMSALIQSNTTDNVCSVKEFGETTSGDNSNYVKIQVDNHSLFGRFIRRGIVDSNIRTITNVLLDKDMNPITTTKSLQSYIGINVPSYKESVIIDPDFSVVLDSYSASSKSNSICSTKSKLSAGKIAGIALGATALAAVLVISLTYYLKKKHQENKFISSVNKKMTQKMDVINNSDNL